MGSSVGSKSRPTPSFALTAAPVAGSLLFMSAPLQNTPPSRRLALFGAGPLPTADSMAAPGIANRLWHHLLPALEAGHDCMVLSIEADAAPLGGGGLGAAGPVEMRRGRWGWRQCAVRPEDCLRPAGLRRLVAEFSPDAIAGAGTLLAGATACAVAAEVPVWVDLFGDPLAEIGAKASIGGEPFSREDHLLVWRLLLGVLTRADAFATVSRRQRDALLGQLLVAGRLDGPRPLADLIHPIPCAFESFNMMPEIEAADGAALKASAGLPGDARVALWNGGFNAWADAATLVAGLERAMDNDPRLRLVVTGAHLPGYLAEVHQDFVERARASRHGDRIHRLGWLELEQARRWMGAADLGLLCDRPCAETRLGARNRLLDLAAARCPMIATRGTEVVEEMEAGGALVAIEPCDAEALAGAIGKLLADPEQRRRLGDQGFEFCRKHYSFAATATPFRGFLADPRRAVPADPERAGTELIAGHLDMDRREAEWAELARLRRGSLPRRLLRRLLGLLEG